MNQREFAGQTMIIEAKPGTNENAKEIVIGGLPVLIEQRADGLLYTSVWMPTADELACLNAGGVVRVACLHVQPPILVDATIAELLP